MWVMQASKDTGVVICRLILEKFLVWWAIVHIFGWKAVYEARRHVESFHPICGWELRLKKKGPNKVVNYLEHVFRFCVLLGCFWI